MRFALTTLLLALILAVPASAGVVNGGLPGARGSNPLAGVRFGAYHSQTRDAGVDNASAYYNTARTPGDRQTLWYLLSKPRFRWFTAAIPSFPQGQKFGAREAAANYIQTVTGGDPRVAAQMAVFRLKPFAGEACTRLPTKGEISDYKVWIDQFARGIGSSRVALVLQPDMPFVRCLPRHSRLYYELIARTTRIFSRLPHTTVYLDAGATDWLSPSETADMLARAGIRGARGFALDLTHYSSTSRQLSYGRKVIRLLAHKGIRDKHYLVENGENGRPFIVQKHRAEFKRGRACATKRDRVCVTLGRPPSVPRRGVVDGYLWMSRPWLNNFPPRGYAELLKLIRSSPFF